MPAKKKATKAAKKSTKSTPANLGPVAAVVLAASKAAGVSQVAAKNVLVAAFAEIKKQVQHGHHVSIRGFGAFRKRMIKGRTVKTPAGKRVTFRTFNKVGFTSIHKI